MKIDRMYIKAQLDRRAAERQLRRVAAGARITLRTLFRIKRGDGCRDANAEALQRYLKRTEKKEVLTHAGE